MKKYLICGFVTLLVSHASMAKDSQAIHCGERVISLPTQWGEQDNKQYVDSLCSNNGAQAYVGKVKGCSGKNVCSIASFITETISPEAASQLESSLGATIKNTVELKNHSVGYYVPSRCAAYCTGARLVWFEKDSINILTVSKSKDFAADIDAMKMSADQIHFVQ